MIVRGPHVKGNVNARGDGDQMRKARTVRGRTGERDKASKLVRAGVAFGTRFSFSTRDDMLTKAAWASDSV